MHIKNVLLRGRGELFLAPKSFPSPPPPPLPSKRALQKQASAEQPAIGRSRPHRSESLQDTRMRSGTKEETRENEQHRHRKAGLQKDSSRDKIIGLCTKSPLPQAARSVMPCPCRPVVRGCRGSCEREREQRKGRAGSLFIFPNQRYPYHRTGTGMAVPCRAGAPLLFSPDFIPRTQKGPLAGALVSFSLIRPEPDTVIGTTRRFQPWRELPSWLRAGGSVR